MVIDWEPGSFFALTACHFHIIDRTERCVCLLACLLACVLCFVMRDRSALGGDNERGGPKRVKGVCSRAYRQGCKMHLTGAYLIRTCGLVIDHPFSSSIFFFSGVCGSSGHVSYPGER